MTKRRLAMERLLHVAPAGEAPGAPSAMHPAAPLHAGSPHSGAAPSGPMPSGAMPSGAMHAGSMHAGAMHSGPVRSGAVRTMGLALDRLTDPAAALESVIEIETGLIDPSFVRDRLDDPDPSSGSEEAADEDPTGIEALARSIAEGGQAVPILVRPHPDDAGRYQIAYGHRRWRACRMLGRPVRAIVRPLGDEDLVLAQGRENNARRDLTFIERAHFAAALVGRGMARPVAGKALGVDKSELARLLAVAGGLPEGLALLIGRAPKAGRPRWLRLVELIKADAGGAEAALTVAAASSHLASDARFKAVFEALTARQRAAGPLLRAPAADPAPVEVAHKAGHTVITIDTAKAPEFGVFVAGQMEALYRRFRTGKS